MPSGFPRSRLGKWAWEAGPRDRRFPPERPSGERIVLLPKGRMIAALTGGGASDIDLRPAALSLETSP